MPPLLRLASAIAALLLLAGEAVAGGFVFSATGAANAANPAQKVAVGEKLAPAELRRRFKGYEVSITQGEDCAICAAITGPAGRLEVHFNGRARTVVQIISRDKQATDTLGNRIGDPVAAAVGTSAVCESGDEMTCASTRVKGLSYVVGGAENCPIGSGDGKKPMDIPSCAKIAGFSVGRR